MLLDFSQDAPTVARQLIGWELVIKDRQGIRAGIITETEAYTANDAASHSFKGQTSRNQAMFLPAGTIYIYRIYGIHHCLNFVCGDSDGQAVLIRGLHPTKGLEFMKAHRRLKHETQLCNGPAKLIEALGISSELNKIHISHSPLTLLKPVIKPTVKVAPRIGISKNVDALWRFYSA